MPSIINASSTGSGGIVQTADASGVLQLQSNGTVVFTSSGANATLSGRVYIGSVSAALANENILTGGQTGGIQLVRNSSGNTTSGQSLGTYAWKGTDSANSNAAAEAMIEAVAAENQSGSTAATDMLFYTKPTGTGPGSSPSLRMTISSNGYVTTPSQPAFYAIGAGLSYRTSGTFQTGVAGGATVILNNGSHYNSTTGVFTAPVNGFYFFSVTVTGGNIAPNLGFGLSKNGTGLQNIAYQLAYNTTYNGNSVSAIVQLQAGDTMRGEMVWNNGVGGDSYSSAYSGFLMG